jgi:filamentous hemagglutinin family protein
VHRGKAHRRRYWTASLALAGALLVTHAAIAQIATDGTLGAAQSLAGPGFSIPASLGQQLGGNLFHSFSQFNLTAGQSATFSGPVDVQNIIGRVTGSSPSSIDGTLRSSIANANLYLINPKGVLFGPNAQIDVSGSLHVSTADYLSLGPSGRFAATNPGTSVLSTAAPSAFGFLAANPAGISVTSSTLAVPAGKGLSLVAGSLNINGAAISAPAGQMNLVATASAGEVALAGPAAGTGGAISIAGQSFIDANSAPGLASGTIRIRGGQFTITDSTLGAINSEAGQGGDVDIQVARLSVTGGGIIGTSTSGPGNAGNLSIAASESVSISGRNALNQRSSLVTAAANNSSGNAGSITITTPLLAMDDSLVNSASALLATGNAGDVTVQVGRLEMINGGQINSSTFGTGRGGNITVNATESATMSGHSAPLDYISGLVAFTFGGDGGSISVSTPALRLDGGIIATGTGSLTGAPAGKADIQVGTATLVNGGRIDGTTFFSGQGGNVTLTARDSIFISGSRDAATTEGLLHAFVFNLAPPIITDNYSVLRPFFGDFATSGLVSRSVFVGPGGSIAAAAPRITIAEGAKISAESAGIGNAGSIALNASDSLTLLSGGSLTTTSLVADGGNITIIAGNKVELRDSSILTSVGQGAGRGGNITIDPAYVILQNSQILANAFGGPGGNISITAGTYIQDPQSLVQASSTLGAPGAISVNAPNLDASAGQVAPSAYFDASLLMRESCSVRASRAANSFTGAGRGGLAAAPDQLSFGVYADVANAFATSDDARPLQVAGTPLACSQ